ncbi:nitrogenase cofactor biosynthesis protein NifB [Paenibacillus sp.]|uniref:nitrogenase cofactor biosynthesis protein NifB n=1 Tax=Paenibacillus sp. TaxID=58172 RepID=UPI0015AE8F9D|nr:nitrogenase cofactor biosynthesis protein NifB [Paenibacillus sp.]MDU2240350.1 nitrogenase cofactor biosynthesis protein NifB [Paenibacillus sp.]
MNLASEAACPTVSGDITKHPCYSEEAHRYFARMHVPVAPACNIQCHYCNRKFDCANESRPGVVSELLSPEEATRKVEGVAAQLLQLSVVGIAGPGDPLANAGQTFRTFRGVRGAVPDVTLCLSTNGLTLMKHIGEIVELGIAHVTITINAVDPDIGSQIYGWVYDEEENRKYEGREAASLLISRQLMGLKALSDKGVLVKVNSVLIPGVNDGHLAVVSRTVKELGAFMHNIMPLIIAPGSRYEQEGRLAPTPRLLHAVQAACGEEGSRIMRHCRQCRADAIGLLGEDRSEDFTREKLDSAPMLDLEARRQMQSDLEEKVRQLEGRKAARIAAGKMEKTAGCACASAETPPDEVSGEGYRLRVAVASRGEGRVNLHFGHAKEFMVYETDGEIVSFLGIRKVQAYCQGRANCNGDKAATLREIIAGLSDCSALFSAGIGKVPEAKLRAAGIIPVVKPGAVEELLLEHAKYERYLLSPLPGETGRQRAGS